MEVLLVEVGGRRLGLPTARVREVAAAAMVTPVPTAPAPVVGLTQLRGQILPVLALAPADTAGGVGFAPRPDDPLVIVELGPARAALLVDRVLGLGSDEGVERVDLGALFDDVRARVQT
jgi:chemotaxis signal transduction protein